MANPWPHGFLLFLPFRSSLLCFLFSFPSSLLQSIGFNPNLSFIVDFQPLSLNPLSVQFLVDINHLYPSQKAFPIWLDGHVLTSLCYKLHFGSTRPITKKPSPIASQLFAVLSHDGLPSRFQTLMGLLHNDVFIAVHLLLRCIFFVMHPHHSLYGSWCIIVTHHAHDPPSLGCILVCSRFVWSQCTIIVVRLLCSTLMVEVHIPHDKTPSWCTHLHGVVQSWYTLICLRFIFFAIMVHLKRPWA